MVVSNKLFQNNFKYAKAFKLLGFFGLLNLEILISNEFSVDDNLFVYPSLLSANLPE